MATKAKPKKARKKTSPKESQIAPPGKYKSRAGGYRFEMVIGAPPNWSRVFHNMKPMDEVTLVTYQRDGAMLGSITDPREHTIASIAQVRRVYDALIETVEGYEDIPDGEPLTDEQKATMPFGHVDKAAGMIMADVGVIAGEQQKNS